MEKDVSTTTTTEEPATKKPPTTTMTTEEAATTTATEEAAVTMTEMLTTSTTATATATATTLETTTTYPATATAVESTMPTIEQIALSFLGSTNGNIDAESLDMEEVDHAVWTVGLDVLEDMGLRSVRGRRRWLYFESAVIGVDDVGERKSMGVSLPVL